MSNQTNVPAGAPEEQSIDLFALVRSLWRERRTILISVGVCFVLGVVAALTGAKEYTVEAVVVPQVNAKSSSSLSSLASLAGFDLGMSTQQSDLSPMIYPQIVNSVPFQLELMNTPFHFEKADSAVSIYTYATEVAKPSVIGAVKKYTIGLPFLLLNALRKPAEELAFPAGSEDESGSQPICMTREEEKIWKSVSKMVDLSVNSKEGYLTLTVRQSEPIVTAEMAQKALDLLQREIIDFKVSKATAELNYIQQRYDEAKAEAEACQEELAKYNDKTKNVVNTASQLELERTRSRYAIANSVYQELAKQLEQAKLQVKKDTPTFVVVKPVVVPMQRTKPKRAQTVVIWLFLGCCIGAGLVLLKEWMPTLKTKWEDAADAPVFPQNEIKTE